MPIKHLVNDIVYTLVSRNIAERINMDKASYLYNIYKKASLQRYYFAKKHITSKNHKKLKILDLGCGSGYGTRVLANGNSIVYGVDRIKLENNGLKNVIFMKMDATHLKFQDKYFDIIVSFETIPMVKDYNSYLKEIKRVLKDDGCLIISASNGRFRKMVFGRYYKKLYNFYMREFETKELYEILREKFPIVELYIQQPIYRKPLALSVFSALPWLVRKPKIVKKSHSKTGLHNIFICKKEFLTYP